MSVVKDVDLEAMPSSIFVNDDDDDDDAVRQTNRWTRLSHEAALAVASGGLTSTIKLNVDIQSAKVTKYGLCIYIICFKRELMTIRYDACLVSVVYIEIAKLHTRRQNKVQSDDYSEERMFRISFCNLSKVVK